MSFISFKEQWKKWLPGIVSDPILHTAWLNTLSYLENCGARKIAQCEHPIKVREEMLKHAAEEFRHAHYLKSQIRKISTAVPEDYSLTTVLGGNETKHYLQRLDLFTCRYLSEKEQFRKRTDIRAAAYILVTYAIELRAEELYDVYNECLKTAQSKVTVKSIVIEEQGHLAEMERELGAVPNGNTILDAVCHFEGKLCEEWLKALM